MCRTSSLNLTERHDGMVRLNGGVFAMGSDRFYPEESPARQVRVDAFWIDATPITNADFARFVEATGHITTAEIAPDPSDYPGMLPNLAQAGSLVFEPPLHPVDLREVSWWDFRIGAHWRTPLGPNSDLSGLADHPAIHVTHADAAAYAQWAGKALPTEAEWEYAARAGFNGADYAWGDQLAPNGAVLANYWQGPFPHGNSMADGFLRTSPVRHYPPNGFGLYDMIGNVWEWTDDWFAVAKSHKKRLGDCCIPANPRGGTRGGSFDKAAPVRVPRKVMKGGSHL
jgi:formylglycine-generating enzyme